MRSPTLEEKIAFFNQLDALDNVSEEDDLVDEKEQAHRDQCRAFFRSRTKAKSVKKSAPQTALETAPETAASTTAAMPTAVANIPAADTPGPGVVQATPTARHPPLRRTARGSRLLASTNTTSFVEETPVPETARPVPSALRRSTTLPLPTSSSTVESPTAGALKKRKRQATTKSVPEAAQIFRGLSFYYIPNNDIAPARKLRIGKAQEYGAQWVRDLVLASHVIVDKHLEYKDIESLLHADAAASLVVVNEDYPIDSIGFRTLLNPDQNRYRIPGRPALTGGISDETPLTSSQITDRSLQVKPARTSRRGSRDTPPGSDLPSFHSDPMDAAEGPQKASHSTGRVPTAASPPQRPAPPRRRSSSADELSGYIELLQQYKDLPLDADEDDIQSVKDAQEAASDSGVDEGSADERARKRTTRPRRSAQKTIPFEERFACNRGGTKDKSADAENPNARTIEVLQSMCDYYTRINDQWRILAYRKGIATLRRQATKITTEEEAFQLPNIGQRLAAKIEEIATTNNLRRLEYANDDPLDQVLETFLKIYDVGTSRANKWIAAGFRTLDDLREKADLTTNQRIGIDHYDDLNTRIPRDEITALFAYVTREAAQLDPSVELLVGGSYRRGSDSSGDIDIIVTKKGTNSPGELVPFLEELVAILTRKGFLVAVLAALHANRPGKDGPGSKWHGCCVLPKDGDGAGGDETPPIWRRIDFLLVPESQYGAALIYFTGNDIFNRSMRLLASKKGMRLNQRGLYKEVMRGKNRAKVTEGGLLEGRDEKRIFELLGVKWREPSERWC